MATPDRATIQTMARTVHRAVELGQHERRVRRRDHDENAGQVEAFEQLGQLFVGVRVVERRAAKHGEQAGRIDDQSGGKLHRARVGGGGDEEEAAGDGEDDAHGMHDDVGKPFFAARLRIPVGVDRLGFRERNVSAHISLPFLVGA